MKSYLPDPGSNSSPAWREEGRRQPPPHIGCTPPRLSLFVAAAPGAVSLFCVRLCADHAVRTPSFTPHSKRVGANSPDQETEAQRRQAACPRSHSRVGIRTRHQSWNFLQGPWPATMWPLAHHRPNPSKRLEFRIGVRLRANQRAGSHLPGSEKNGLSQFWREE